MSRIVPINPRDDEPARRGALPSGPEAEGFGAWELLEEIGRGGMGIIYRARRRDGEGRIVALKVLQPALAHAPELGARFRREADAMARLDHPHLLPVLELAARAGDCLPYFVMQFAEGGSLTARLPELMESPRDAALLVAKVARGVAHAHERGLLHRDLKPDNILLDAAGEPLVTDFGLARWLDDPGDLTRSLVVIGTAGYIAPEQAEGSGRALTPSADVYSLGVILFEMIGGRRPFVGENTIVVLRRSADEEPPSLLQFAPDAPGELAEVCSRCLQPDPRDRYQSADELAEDLERWLRGLPITRRTLALRVRARRFARKQRHWLIGTGTVLVALGATWAGREWALRPNSQDYRRGSANPQAQYFFARGAEVISSLRDARGLEAAREMFQRAAELDPAYAHAHAELSRAHSTAWAREYDRTEFRASQALREAEEALRLNPRLGRAWLAMGEYWFRVRREPARALDALRRARDLDPRNLDVHGLIAVVAKRMHRWDEAVASALKLCELQPRQTACLYDLGVTYEVLRRYPEALKAFERAEYLAPDQASYIGLQGRVRWRWKGELARWGDYVRILRPADRLDESALGDVLEFYLLTGRRDEALSMVEALPADYVLRDTTVFAPKPALMALVRAARGESGQASVAAAAALELLDERLRAVPNDARALAMTARLRALLDRPDEALAAARRAVALVPIDAEPVDGPDYEATLAEVEMRAGKWDDGIARLRRLLAKPGYLTVHDLRRAPRWEFARAEPRFAVLLKD